MIERNVAAFPVEQVEVLAMPAERALRLLERRASRFDLVFLDPPYGLDLLPSTLSVLAGTEIIRTGGLVVCEHFGKTAPPSPPSGWHAEMTRRYGDVALTLLRAGKGAPS